MHTQYTIADISLPDGTVDGPFGSNLPASAYQHDGIPVIRGVNLSLGEERFKDHNYVFVSEKTAKRLKRSVCQAGDLIFTKKGTLGQTGIVPAKNDYKRFLLSSNQMRVRVDPSLADPLYVYYFASSLHSRSRILADAMTAGVPKINLTYLRRFQILLPSLKVQRKIVALVSTYDDLIETNKRRIALLEKMAEELYREWFVRMRFPGYQTTKFVKGVPNGWEIKRLGEILELAYGKALKDADRKPGEFDVYGSGGVVGTHSKALVQEKGIIVGRKGNVGAVFYSDRGFFPIDTVYYVVSKLPLTYLFHLLQTMNFINNDAAVPGLNRNQAYSNQLYWPGENLVQMYAIKAEPLFTMKFQLVTQNKLLTKTRDLLLPRLISGKLSVDDLDIQLPPSMREEAG